MRIVIFSDSMGMPRPNLLGTDQTHIWDVYGSLLKERYRGIHDVELVYVGGLDSEDAAKICERMVAYREPDLVILHIGLTDCAPRLYRKGSKHLFLQPWFSRITRDLGMRFLSHYRRQVTRVRPIVYVRPQAFAQNMQMVRDRIRSHCPDVSFCAIGIVLVADRLDQRSWGYHDKIRTYNGILQSIFADGFVDSDDLVAREQMFISDGFHLTKAAHTALEERLAGRIDRELGVPKDALPGPMACSEREI